jgi:pyruvate formate lyase activating enzyme
VLFEIQRWSTDDGPGIRTTLFFQGCPMRCLWCCNPEAWCPAPPGLEGTADPADELRGRTLTVPEIVAAVERDRVFYRTSGGGVTFSGGEPTCQPDLLRALALRLHDLGLHLALETCGHFPWDPNAEALARMDLVHLDLKHLDREAHRRLTGVPNDQVLANALRLAGAGIPLVLRLPLVPGLNDDPANLAATARFAGRLGNPPLQVMPYHALGLGKYRALGLECPTAGLQPPSAGALAAARQVLADHGAKLV